MEYIEKAGTRRQMEVLSKAVDTTHCEEHGDRRAESEEVARSEHQLRIADHRHPGTTSTHDEIHRCIGCRSQQRIADTEQRNNADQ